MAPDHDSQQAADSLDLPAPWPPFKGRAKRSWRTTGALYFAFMTLSGFNINPAIGTRPRPIGANA